MPSVGIIGVGNMGASIVKRWIDDGVEPSLIKAIDHHPESLEALGLEPSSYDDLTNVEAIVLTVKPHDIKQTLKEAKVSADTLIISMAAGVTLEDLASVLPKKQAICRVMPNIGVRIGQGVLAVAQNEHLSDCHKENLEAILAPLGKVIHFKEKDFDTVTALAGSGPAFASQLLEGCVLGGIAGGVSKTTAQELVLNTFQATIELIRSGMSYEDIRYMVSSPAGSTIAGLEILESDGVKGSITEAIKATAARAKELGNN